METTYFGIKRRDSEEWYFIAPMTVGVIFWTPSYRAAEIQSEMLNRFDQSHNANCGLSPWVVTAF